MINTDDARVAKSPLLRLSVFSEGYVPASHPSPIPLRRSHPRTDNFPCILQARRAARDGDDYDYSNDGNYIDDDDSDSDGYNSRRRRRGSHSDGRRRRASVNYGMYAQPGVGAGALAIPGAVTPTAGGYVPTYGNVGVQYAQASPGMQTMPLGGVGYGGAQVAGGYGVQQVPMPVSPYQQAAYLPQVGVPGAGYAAGAGGLLGVPGAGGVRQRSNSFTGYPASPGYY